MHWASIFRGPILICIMWGAAPQALAQSPLLELAAEARAAKDDFQPLSVADTAQARQRLIAAAADLDRLLSAQGPNGQRWREFLAWPELQALQGEFEGLTGEQFGAVLERLEADKPGLDRPQVAALRQAVNAYGDMWLSINDPPTAETYAEVMERLAAALEEYAAAPSGAAREKISVEIEWLRANRQALPLVAKIVAQFNHPNLVLVVAPPVFQAVASRKIDQTDPVRDNILDTEVYGVSRTIGGTNVALPDDPNRSVMELQLRATAYSDTVGYNGPVRIFSEGVTRLFGAAEILITGEGLVPGAVTARACTSNTTKCIDSRFNGILDRLVVRIARRRSEKLAPQANAIAASRAAARVRNQLTEEVARQTAQSNENLNTRVRHPLLRRDAFPARLSLANREGRLNITVGQADPFQLGAPAAAASVAGQPDLAIRLHESYVQNFAADFFANRTVTEADMRRDFPNLFRRRQTPASDAAPAPPGEAAAEDAEGEDEPEEMGITFAGDRPVTLHLDDGLLTLRIRGQQFFARGRTYDVAMNITIRYQSEKTASGVRLTMVGEPEVQSPDIEEGLRERLTPQETAVRNIFSQRLAKNLDREIVRDSITLPGQLEKLGPMGIIEWSADDGWLAVSLLRQAASPLAQASAGGGK